MTTTLLPLFDRVIVRRTPKADRTASGIELFHRKEEHPDQGRVVAVNARAEAVQVGDEVIFEEGRGQPLEHEGERLVVLREEDLHAVVERA